MHSNVNYLTLYVESPALDSGGRFTCEAFSSYLTQAATYRYVLIPLPSALGGTSLTGQSALERLKADDGLSDLSYAAVKQRVGLKD